MLRSRVAVGLVSAMAVATLTGCETFGGPDFIKSGSSGVTDAASVLIPIQGTALPQSPWLDDKQLRDVAEARCLPKADSALAPAIVPILAALGQLAVNLHIENKQRRIEEIVENSKAAYSLTVHAPPDALTTAHCILFVRHGVNANGQPDKTGLQVLIKLEQKPVVPPGAGAAFIFTPVYVRAFTSVAQTANSEKPTVALSVAVSVKAISRHQADGLARLVPVGEGTVGVGSVGLGDQAEAKCVKPACKFSDLIPYPTNKGTLSITLAIAEQGVTGFNDKAVLADLAALKEALGPAIAEAIKVKFED